MSDQSSSVENTPSDHTGTLSVLHGVDSESFPISTTLQATVALDPETRSPHGTSHGEDQNGDTGKDKKVIPMLTTSYSNLGNPLSADSGASLRQSNNPDTSKPVKHEATGEASSEQLSPTTIARDNGESFEASFSGSGNSVAPKSTDRHALTTPSTGGNSGFINGVQTRSSAKTINANGTVVYLPNSTEVVVVAGTSAKTSGLGSLILFGLEPRPTGGSDGGQSSDVGNNTGYGGLAFTGGAEKRYSKGWKESVWGFVGFAVMFFV